MHKRLIKFLNFKNEGKEINVKRVLRMLNSKDPNVRNLILSAEWNEHFHQNMSEEAIQREISELIVAHWEDNQEDIVTRWFGYSTILDSALKELFRYEFSNFCHIGEAYSFLRREDPHAEIDERADFYCEPEDVNY